MDRTIRRPLRARAAGSRRKGRRFAFTLIELMVVVGILTVLMSIVLTSLARVRVSARSFVCKNKLKTVAFEFIQFADDYAHPWRGDSDGKKGFFLEDFQERLYGISEFWKTSSSGVGSNVTVPLDNEDHPLMCSAGPRDLYRTSGLSCRQAITPRANISIGFNKSLEQIQVSKNGRPVWVDVTLTRRVLTHATVPLAFDVDGQEADARSILPLYAAPPPRGVSPSAWSFWFPSMRHGGQVNAAFIGGHVLSSVKPDAEGGWDWRYKPPVK